jgi:EAL domain-containing protein (putative c-di-GMP-specific phosphodiesterase class I)
VDGEVFGDEAAMDTIRRLHALGVVVSMDDVGSGFVSLEWLGQVPVDELKLDRSLVERLDQPVGQGRGVAEAVIDVVLRLGLAITAEGVGTENQAERLAGLGCPRAQGWLFGRPLPYSRFSGLIDRMTAPEPLDPPSHPVGASGASDARATPPGAPGESRSPLDRLG